MTVIFNLQKYLGVLMVATAPGSVHRNRRPGIAVPVAGSVTSHRNVLLMKAEFTSHEFLHHLKLRGRQLYHLSSALTSDLGIILNWITKTIGLSIVMLNIHNPMIPIGMHHIHRPYLLGRGIGFQLLNNWTEMLQKFEGTGTINKLPGTVRALPGRPRVPVFHLLLFGPRTFDMVAVVQAVLGIPKVRNVPDVVVKPRVRGCLMHFPTIRSLQTFNQFSFESPIAPKIFRAQVSQGHSDFDNGRSVRGSCKDPETSYFCTLIKKASRKLEVLRRRARQWRCNFREPSARNSSRGVFLLPTQ